MAIQIPVAERKEQNTKRERPVIKAGMYTLELFDAKMVKDERFGDARFGFMKLRLVFRIVSNRPKQNDKAHVEAAIAAGYGLVFSLDFRPVYSPPGQKRDASGQISATNASSLYVFLTVANGGTPADNLVLATTPEEHAAKLSAHLDRLVANKTQFTATVKRTQKEGVWRNDFAVDSFVEVVAEEDRLPSYEFIRPRDPREDNDDPTLVCEVTGQQIHGYENYEGVWVSNEEAARQCKERWGKVLCPSEIRKLKDARAAQAATLVQKMASANNGDEEDIPF